ncbi:MAG: hypothetical protein R2795_04315 [Saprospiraceae bacterium]
MPILSPPKIPWNGDDGTIWAALSPDEMFTKHEGDLAGVQYAALAVLHHFGFKAYPVLLSTRDHGAVITEFPLMDQFNYVVIILNIDDKWKLVDFSNPLFPVGIINERALNKEGFVLNEENPGWIDIVAPSFQDLLAYNGSITADGTIVADMKSVKNGYSAYYDRSKLKDQTPEKLWAERFPDNTVFTDMAVEFKDEKNNALKVSSHVEIPEAGMVNGDFIYFTPIQYSLFTKNPFQREKRNYPIDFPYPFEEKNVVSYALPEGYTVESIPEALNLSFKEGGVTLQFIAQEKNGKVNTLMTLKVQQTRFSPDDYPALRDMFEQIAQKLQEQVVLKKA